MHYVNFALAATLAALSLAHLDAPDRTMWMSTYAVGAMLALCACNPHLKLWTVRVLATTALLAMFLYLGGFFSRAPYLGEDWYAAEDALGTISLLLAGFCMMPVIAEFSCRMKRVLPTA